MEKNDITIGTIIGIILLIASVIIFFQILFWLFLFLFIISFIALVIGIIYDLTNREHYELIFIYPLIATGSFLLLALVSFFFGYGLASTSIGQFSLDTAETINNFNNEIDTSINDAIIESCKSLTNESCETLKNSIETYQTAQDVLDYAETFKSIT